MCIVGAEQCPANIVNVCCSGASKSCIGGACVSSNIDNLDLVNLMCFNLRYFWQ